MPTQGQRVGEYVLDSTIGRGSFGEVWRARHHVWTEQIVAVKLPTDPAYLRQLQREGFAAPSLNHPSIVRAIGFDPFADPPYLAMEYVPGTSLRPYVSNRRLSVEDSILILRTILEALSHAHSQGIVHRDVKPENVLVHERADRESFASPGVIKLTDFGLGQNTRTPANQSVVMSISVETDDAKKLAGTIDYMSPEQRAGQSVDGRTDLYACGVMLFEMLTGERPAGNEVPSDVNPKSPKWLDEVFKRSYARLEKRYTSAADFVQALDAGTKPIAVRRVGSCTRCNGQVGPRDQFCIHCGTQLVAHIRRCVACGGYPAPEDRFCILCGSELPASVG